jgi:hypothetical protein
MPSKQEQRSEETKKSTYTYSEESVEDLMVRMSHTFNEAFEVLLHGFKQKTKY